MASAASMRGPTSWPWRWATSTPPRTPVGPTRSGCVPTDPWPPPAGTATGSVRCTRGGTSWRWPRDGECGVDAWTDVVAVAVGNVHTAANTGRAHTVGLRSDGSVAATGWNGDGQ